jgi:hypothetical protein
MIWSPAVTDAVPALAQASPTGRRFIPHICTPVRRADNATHTIQVATRS